MCCPIGFVFSALHSALAQIPLTKCYLITLIWSPCEPWYRSDSFSHCLSVHCPLALLPASDSSHRFCVFVLDMFSVPGWDLVALMDRWSIEAFYLVGLPQYSASWSLICFSNNNQPEQVFIVDKTGLFLKKIPSRT